MPSDQSRHNLEERGSTDLKEGLSRELDAAGSALHDARDELQEKAGDVVAKLKDMGSEKAEAVQKTFADSLTTFVGALRAAGDHLQQSDQPQASSLVQSAVGAVEGLAASIKDKPFADVVSEVRNYGQSNPGALLAGSVLAGLALGRLLKSSAPAAGSTPTARNTQQGNRHADRSQFVSPGELQSPVLAHGLGGEGPDV